MCIILNKNFSLLYFFFPLCRRGRGIREIIERCLYKDEPARTEIVCLREERRAVVRRPSTRKCRLEDRPMLRCTSLEHDCLLANLRGSWRDSLPEDLCKTRVSVIHYAYRRGISSSFIIPHIFPYWFFHSKTWKCHDDIFRREDVSCLCILISSRVLELVNDYLINFWFCSIDFDSCFPTYCWRSAVYLYWQSLRNLLGLYTCRCRRHSDLPWQS